MTNMVFWSPIHGQGANTVHTVATAIMFALESDNKTLLTHTQLHTSTMEDMLSKENAVVINGFQNDGIDSIVRLVRSGKLSGDALADYTEIVIGNRLDLLAGSKRKLNEEQSFVQRAMGEILEAAQESYKATFIDAHAGSRSELTNALLADADFVFVNLPQNKYVIERFISGEDFPEVLKEKDFAIIISNYDEESQFSLKNIKRKLNIKQPMFAIPYNTQFKDAINKAEVGQFLFRLHEDSKPNPNEAKFVEHILKIVKFILKKMEIDVDEWYDEDDE